jgi:hypothetical protein
MNHNVFYFINAPALITLYTISYFRKTLRDAAVSGLGAFRRTDCRSLVSIVSRIDEIF